MGLPQHWDPIVAYTLSHAAIWNSISNIVTSGVVERHPKLKFVVAEWETGWLAHTLQRWDHAFYRSRTAASPDLSLLPSEYFKRNFMITFEDDDIGLRTFDYLGPENLLWGNDYPHHDSIWPNSMEVLDRIMTGVSEQDKNQMVWENVKNLYNINPDKLDI
jgi:predicted TIM-barrel fold metal-dependent hydrolase